MCDGSKIIPSILLVVEWTGWGSGGKKQFGGSSVPWWSSEGHSFDEVVSFKGKKNHTI